MISFVYNSEFDFCAAVRRVGVEECGENLAGNLSACRHLLNDGGGRAVGEFIYLAIRSNVSSSAVDAFNLCLGCTKHPKV